MGGGSASLPSINREKLWVVITLAVFPKNLFKFFSFALLGHHDFFSILHQIEEEKGEDEGGGNNGQALVLWESGWYAP